MPVGPWPDTAFNYSGKGKVCQAESRDPFLLWSQKLYDNFAHLELCMEEEEAAVLERLLEGP